MPAISKMREFAYLGKCLEIVSLEGSLTRKVSWPFCGEPVLLWEPIQKVLLVVEDLQLRWKETLGENVSAKVYERWSQFIAEQESDSDIPKGRLLKSGPAVSIAYQSDKWEGTLRDYEHTFAKSDELFENEQGTVFAIEGPRLTVNHRGIVY